MWTDSWNQHVVLCCNSQEHTSVPQNSEWHSTFNDFNVSNDILSLSNVQNVHSMLFFAATLWIVFSVFWSFRVAPRSGTNAEWYQGPGPISISWISSPFSWNLQRREKSMLPIDWVTTWMNWNQYPWLEGLVKSMIEINSWVSVGKVLPLPQSEVTQFKKGNSNEWKQMKAETPVDWFTSDPAAFMILASSFETWRQFPRCNLCTSVLWFTEIYCVYFDTIKSYRPPFFPLSTSPPLCGAVGSSSAAGSVWRKGGSSSAGVDSAPRDARATRYFACHERGQRCIDAFWCILPMFCPESWSACNAKSCPVVLQVHYKPFLRYGKKLKLRKNIRTKDAQRYTTYHYIIVYICLYNKWSCMAKLGVYWKEKLRIISAWFSLASFRRDRWLILNIKNLRKSFRIHARSKFKSMKNLHV